MQDVVNALVKLMESKAAKGKVVNIGNAEEVTIMQLAERVKALTGSDSPIKLIPYNEAYEDGFEDMLRRVPSLERAKQLIGYQPTHSLDDILHDVIDYERGKM